MPSRDHCFMALGQSHASRQEARNHVEAALRHYGVTDPLSHFCKRGRCVKIVREGTAELLTVDQLIQEVVDNGILPVIDGELRHRTDESTTISLAVPCSLGAPMSTSVGSQIVGSLDGPGFMTSDIEGALAADILWFREQCVVNSSVMNAEMAFRFYRAYLGACISMIDAMLNRLAFLHLDSKSGTPVDDRDDLANRNRKLDHKLNAWIPMLASGKRLDNQGRAWNAFQRLRARRNEVVHIKDPILQIRFKDAVRVLNDCRQGVGQLVVEIRSLLDQWPWPQHLRVRFAREVKFIPLKGVVRRLRPEPREK